MRTDASANTFTYDAENHQLTASQGSSSYTYDGDDRRVTKTTGGIFTVFVYDVGGRLVAEYGGPQGTNGGTSYLTTDHLGSTRLVADSQGNVRARHDYMPFGEEISAGIGNRTASQGYGGSDDTRQKFTQKERDNESNLDYFGARYYSGAQGRFTGADPLLSSGLPSSPQSWNRYVYTVNNPMRFVDPSGLFIIDPNLTPEQRAKILAGYNLLKSSKAKYKRGSEDYKRIGRALGALGAPGQRNGVTITVGEPANPEALAQTGVSGSIKPTKANPTGFLWTITFNKGDFGDLTETSIAGTEGHEATHLADQRDFAAAEIARGAKLVDFNLVNTYKTEMNAFMTEGAVAQAVAPDQADFGWGNTPAGRSNLVIPYSQTKLYLWNPAWANVDAAQIQVMRSVNINAYLTTPKNQGGAYGLERPK